MKQQARYGKRHNWRHVCRVGLLLVGGLLGGSEPGYSGGPTFSQDVLVRSNAPGVALVDTDTNAGTWVLKADGLVAEAFGLAWGDEGQNGLPFVIENRAPDNALYVDGTGHVGLGTAAPAEELHIVDEVFPTIRFEQNGPFLHVWELGGYSGGFTVLDITNSDVPFIINPGAGDSALHIAPGGNVGMGTSSPTEAVDVVREGAASRFQLTSFSNDPSDAAQFIQRRARGTQFFPAPVQSGDNIGLFSFRGMRPNATFSGSRATITAQATQNWTNTAQGTRLVFGTTPNGTTTVQSIMEITHDGRVLINGSQLNVPDYVFAEDYDLMPLDKLKTYITEHKHLPEVASGAEVKQGGVDLGGTQMALLKKIEELTLYTLQQHEQLTALQQGKMELEQRLAALEQQQKSTP